MILFETGSDELFSKLHSGTVALMQECHDNILMKPSAVRVKTGAERNVSTSRTEILMECMIVHKCQYQKGHSS